MKRRDLERLSEIFSTLEGELVEEGRIIVENELEKRDNKEKTDGVLIKDTEGKDQYEKIAKSFWALVRKNMMTYGIKSKDIENVVMETWSDPIRKLIEIDGKTVGELREVYDFLDKEARKASGQFSWAEQILSTQKLRQKNKNGIKYIDVLLMQARKNRGQSNKTVI